MDDGVRFERTRELAFRITTPEDASIELESRVAAHWADTLSRNPRLFNGPLMSPISVSIADGCGTVDVRRSDYAHYMYARSTADAASELTPGTIFVSLIVPLGGSRFIVGRMARHTAAPGIVQLPGGGVTDVTDLRTTAVEEAAEELGLNISPLDLRLVGLIIRSGPLDVGAAYRTRTYDRGEVNAAFNALLARERSAGKLSEFDQLFEVDVSRGEHWQDGVGNVVDYLGHVVRVLHEDGFA